MFSYLLMFLKVLAILAGLISARFWWLSATLESSHDYGAFGENENLVCFDSYNISILQIIKYTFLCLFNYNKVLLDYEAHNTIKNYEKILHILNSMAALYAAIAMLLTIANEIISAFTTK